MSTKILLFLIGFLTIITTSCTAPTPTESLIPTSSPTPLPLFIPSPVSETTSTPLPPHTPTPALFATDTPTPSLPKPLATAAMVAFAGWSPDSQWVAYWTYTLDEIHGMQSEGAPGYPPGTLHFYDLESGELCEYLYPASYSFSRSILVWQDDGRAAVLGDDGIVRVGAPCGNESETLMGAAALIAVRDPSLSPDHTFRAETIEVAYDPEKGVQSNITIITKTETGEEWGRVTWSISLRLGWSYQTVWLTDDLLLIPETKERGPLLVRTDGEITEIVAELFGITESCFGQLCAASTRALASSDPETGVYHLALFWNGFQTPNPYPNVMLYHSETGEAEAMRFDYVYWDTFSPDGKWLLLRSEESDAATVWARTVDLVGGDWVEFPSPPYRMSWSPDGGKVAFSTQLGNFWVQTFPEKETLAYWGLNLMQDGSVSWSPDGERIAVIASWYDSEQKAALYLLDCCKGSPTILVPTLTPTPANPPPPTAEALPIPSIDLARGTLLTFFNLLHLGRYEEAIPLYGGTYEILQDWNPVVAPNDYPMLLKNGCESNGLQCLLVLNIISQAQISPNEFRFVVELMFDDGTLFVRGPCCGASEEDMPPVSQFEYTVIRGEDGQFRVTGLPVYVP